jgi:hypothetical protein
VIFIFIFFFLLLLVILLIFFRLMLMLMLILFFFVFMRNTTHFTQPKTLLLSHVAQPFLLTSAQSPPLSPPPIYLATTDNRPSLSRQQRWPMPSTTHSISTFDHHQTLPSNQPLLEPSRHNPLSSTHKQITIANQK